MSVGGNPIKKLPEHTVKVEQPSHRYNNWVQNNFKGAHGHLRQVRKTKPHIYDHVHDFARQYRDQYNNHWNEHGKRYKQYYHDDRYRYSCSRWYPRGFYGGYFYPVRLCQDITIYFDYPIIYWFYAGDLDYDFYEGYYGNDYYEYPVTVNPFASVFYPTETLQDLGVDVSGLSAHKQSQFRQGIVIMVDHLRQAISEHLQADYQFGSGEIVLNHYENLKNEVYVLEGFVNGQGVNVPFKALIDLDDPSLSAVYAAFADDPSGQDTSTLDWINSRIQQFGGNPYQAYLEPAQP